MLGSRILLLSALAATTVVTLAVLVPNHEEPEMRCPPLRRPPVPGSERCFDLGEEAWRRAPSQPAPVGGLVDERDAEIVRLRLAIVVLADEGASLRTELIEQEALWEARLARSRLEDELHEMLVHEFPDITAMEDPNADVPIEDQLVAILLGVAEWLGPQAVEIDGVERAGPRPIGLADVRATVSDGTVRALAQRLPWWSLQLALWPAPRYRRGCGNGGGRSAATLYTMREIDGEVVSVLSDELASDDPRVEAAKRANDRVRQQRARDLEALVGLPFGALGHD